MLRRVFGSRSLQPSMVCRGIGGKFWQQMLEIRVLGEVDSQGNMSNIRYRVGPRDSILFWLDTLTSYCLLPTEFPE